MKRVNISVLFTLLSFLLVSSASANMVTYTGSYNGATDVTNRVISVSQFDPSLGSLVSVTFNLDATMTTQAFADNDGDFYAGWDKSQYNFLIAGDTAYSDVSISASNAPIRIVGTGEPDGDFSSNERARIIGQPSWYQYGPALTETGLFSKNPLEYFIGAGDLNFFLTTLNSDTIYVAGNQTGGVPPSHFGVSTNVLANVAVTYDYTPVPIPGAILLLGSGLIGLAGLRKRIK